MIHDIFTNISILLAFLLVVGQVFKNNSFGVKQSLQIQALLGMVFGALGVILMLFTIEMSHNMIIDLRNIAIICSGIMGGPVSAVISAVIIAVSRIILFDVSTVSVMGLLSALLVGIGTAYICNLRLSRFYKYLLMFMFSMLVSNAALIYLIRDKSQLLGTLVYYWPICIFGAGLAYFTCEYIVSANLNFKIASYYRMTADNLLDVISIHEPGGEVIFVSPSVTQLFGYTPEEFIGTSAYDYIHPEDSDVFKGSASITENYGGAYTRTFRMRRKDGKYIWVETSLKAVKNDDGFIKEIIGVTRDITARKKIEQELRVSNARLKAIFNNAGTGIVLRDCNGKLLDANQAYIDMTGFEKEEVSQLSSIVHPEDYDNVQKLFDDLVTGKSSSDKSEVRYLDKNGKVMYTEVISTFIPGTEYTPASVIRVVNDITERKRKEEELIKAKYDADRLAATDFLTGILNRRAFSERFDEELKRAEGDKRSICLILADIDHFKEINDLHGHQVGDLVLQKFTKCLSKVCRPDDFIGRHGGEEFLICLPDVELEQGKRIAERMRQSVEELNINLLYLREPIKLTASFGVASYIPEKGETADTLILRADKAMYDAKLNGRNKVFTTSETIVD